jgi:hypothetical protein
MTTTKKGKTGLIFMETQWKLQILDQFSFQVIPKNNFKKKLTLD